MSTSDHMEPQDIERRDVKEQDAAVYNAHLDASGINEVKLVRKMDWWLLPWLSLLSLLSILDRTSIGNAKVSHLISLFEIFNPCFRQLYNLVHDLRLSDKQYLLCLTIFFFSYSFFEARPLSPCASPASPNHVLIGPE
jgi:hypothetical protein